jgi:hypothetical protein
VRGDGEDHCENLLSSFRDLLARSETCRDGSQTEVPFLNCDVRFPPDSDQTADIEQGRGRAKNAKDAFAAACKPKFSAAKQEGYRARPACNGGGQSNSSNCGKASTGHLGSFPLQAVPLCACEARIAIVIRRN